MNPIQLAGAAVTATLATVGMAQPKPGEVTEIHQSYKSDDRSSDGGSGNSSGRSALQERVVAYRADGIELEYDLPRSASPQDREREWQFPARILRQPDGSRRLLNADALEARSAAWLAKAKWTREVCGKTIFTWTAFKIECDPQTVLATVAGFDLDRQAIRPGEPYTEPGVLQAALVKTAGSTKRGPSYTVTLALDPEAIRRTKAESAVLVGEITGKPVTMAAALAALGGQKISGTTTLTFDTEKSGRVWRIVRQTSQRFERTDGQWETHQVEERLERKSVKPLSH